ncbi:MAG: winged helix-turn-helix domain-containing protein [Phenylobacterium sp.]|uniref:winged helix-turn-helix domain-containing protein n=1 Tax=Phenylobacterium sp. TaxID=1871053 RepID=UPI002732C136|nr:winged helix-turn-helix domain-containing protein [Phenylobacterium sp.]MDP3748351.1 winged helix-turn-helix domain-containing protein [Phenylobacterium sp.]
MNEHVAIRWPELNLARELPFSLAGTQVRPAALELEHDGKVVTLEPRVMKVLVALHRSRGQPVSRDELIDLCWGGRIVTEGALNRCVAQLRKALGDNPRISVDTIATVGYRLQASADVHRVAPATEPATAERVRPKVSRQTLVMAAGFIGVAVAAVAVLLITLPRPVNWTARAFQPLTSERGLETHPALSPDGGQLVYAQRADLLSRRDLYLRSVGQGTPVRITTDPADDHSAAWSPKGDRIAFVRTPATGECSIVVTPIPLGPERIVARCQSATYARVSWLDENTLVFGDRRDAASIWRIRAVNIETGAVRDLTDPPASTLGDGDPMASPDGRHVLFRRTLMHGADDLFLLDVKTGRERALTTDGWKAPGYVWSADGRHVFFASNRGGAFGLWTVDTKIDGPPRQVSLGLGQISFSRMSADRRNRVAVELPSGRNNLAVVAPDGRVRPLTTDDGNDWDPDGAADGTVAYTSDRSGSSELWITTQDGRSVRLTSIVGSYVHQPAWSPDGQTIAFIAVKGRRAEIYTVARDGSRLRPVTHDGLDKLDPVYAADGRSLSYVERTAAGYRVMRIALTPGAEPRPLPGGEGWRVLRGGEDGRLYGMRVGETRLRALSPGRPVPPVELGGYDEWAVGPDGLVVMRGYRASPSTVWLHPWTGAPRKLVDIPNCCGSVGVSSTGAVLFSQSQDDQVDLGLVDLAAN